MQDLSHLNALEYRLHREKFHYLPKAKTQAEIAARNVWIAQIEREIAREREFLGLTATSVDLSDDDLLAELGA